jgi:hypothetical protein
MVFGALLLANVSSASIILNLVGGAPTKVGADFDFTYNVVLSADQDFDTNDFTEVIDFSDVTGTPTWTPGALSTGNASISMVATGPGEPPAGGTDSASIPNVVVTNTGPNILGTSNGGFSVTLGQLVVMTTADIPPTEFSSEGVKIADGTNTYNQGYFVPDPATVSLLGAGLLLAGLLGRRRSK